MDTTSKFPAAPDAILCATKSKATASQTASRRVLVSKTSDSLMLPEVSMTITVFEFHFVLSSAIICVALTWLSCISLVILTWSRWIGVAYDVISSPVLSLVTYTMPLYVYAAAWFLLLLQGGYHFSVRWNECLEEGCFKFVIPTHPCNLLPCLRALWRSFFVMSRWRLLMRPCSVSTNVMADVKIEVGFSIVLCSSYAIEESFLWQGSVRINRFSFIFPRFLRSNPWFKISGNWTTMIPPFRFSDSIFAWVLRSVHSHSCWDGAYEYSWYQRTSLRTICF